MRPPLWHRLLRLTFSVGLIGALLAICLGIPHIDNATVALLLVLAVVGIATIWGSIAAFAGAMVGCLGLDYFFLPPPGFGIKVPEGWVTLGAFSLTAIAAGQLAAQSRRRQIQAVERRNEIETLYHLVNTLLEGGNAEATLNQLAGQIAEIFGATGVALYDKHTEQIVRSGPHAGLIAEQALRDAAMDGRPVDQPISGFCVTPIRHGSELVGSIGINRPGLSPTFLNAMAARVGLGLARLYAIERTTEAEVVRRSEQLKSAVLDALAHEIRNPLNSVKIAATTLLSGRSGGDSNRREMLTIIDEEVDRMDRFIDEAVQLARMEANELSLHKEPHDMAHLIPAAVREMGALTAHRQVLVNVPRSLPPAECDQGMILRVLKQLLNNALKYSPRGSPLTVSAEFKGTVIVIDVIDQGPGVAEEERERIFEKYYRGRAARVRSPGTGLGLASAKCIVEAHGGEIWVTSPPGGGAAFHVSLPIAAAKHPVGAA